MNKMLSFLNTKTGTKEFFTPANEVVSLYVCGVTPYDFAHMGHARCYVSFDLLYRVLQFWGYPVKYVRNVTDVDDKIVRKAAQEVEAGGDIAASASQVALRYTKAFNQDMAALNILSPALQPTISANISQIISFIEKLIAAGHAYVAGEDVYFSLDSHASYGNLSGRSLEELSAGARIEINEHKRNPGDFVLWKGNVVGSFWQSPWGPGRPGWHIECSTLVKEYLGEHIDIHGGGIDLLFPHHENECAQSEALFGAPFARYWLHNAHVTLQSEKMSKSLGNVFMVRDVLKDYDPMVVRFYLLQHHYRTPLDIDMVHIASAVKAYNRLVRAFNREAVEPGAFDVAAAGALWQQCAVEFSVCSQILDALADDLNLPKALGLIFGNLEELAADKITMQAIRMLLQQVCGLPCMPLVGDADQEVSSEIAALLEARVAARVAKDWALADKLRDELAQRGYTPVDGKITR